jgi:membrane protease YdiL (CAAX protease family)
MLADVGPSPEDGAPSPAGRPSAGQRAAALAEVAICSDYPTQLALGAGFAVFGFRPFTSDGHLSVPFVVSLSLVDTVLLIGLIVLFLRARGERVRDVWLGSRSAAAEAWLGLPLTIAAFAIGVGVLAFIQAFVPKLHNVAHNPLADLIVRRRDAWLFALVVIVAGGVREELQRAFVLHRFEVWLGGPMVGIVVGSAAFGAGHVLQGADAVIATGLLGAFWGCVYLRRRSPPWSATPSST